MMAKLPDIIRKNHTDIILTKPFTELQRGKNTTAPSVLVATLYRVYKSRGVLNAVRFMGLSHNAIYRRLRDLERRVGCPVFVRFQKRFVLTEYGKKLVREYLDD